jgi:peptide/nickel transport system substrate-binding protein
MTRLQVRILASAILVCVIVLTGCGGAPAAPQSAAPEQAVIDVPGGEFTGRVLQYNTIADYEAETGNMIDSFQQAPMLDALVANGTLPPVEERLPDEPLVIQPAERIAKYGGTMVDNHEGDVDFLEDILREFPHMYDSDMEGVLPNIFIDYEVSDDNQTFIFHIRPGMKWSDGEPYGADDFVFWYEAIASNTELNPTGVNDMKAGGKMGTLTKIDDHTIQMSFSAPYGILLERLARWRPMPYAPAHYLSQFHPGYTDPAEVNAIAVERGYTNWVELFQTENDPYSNPDIPTIYAWRSLTRGASVPVQELERNPYYWKVDVAGNQLPYIDRISRSNLGDPEAILLSVLAGDNDVMHAHNVGYLTNYPLLKQNEQSGGYRILPLYGWSDVVGIIAFNMSTDDPVLRELFNNQDFRIALSIGYDRNNINEVVFNGLYSPSQPAPPDTSVYNGADPAFKRHTEYDPDRANEILDSLGLAWNSNGTQRLLPDGRPLELSALVNTGWIQQVPIAELIAQGWEDLGIVTVLQPQAGNFINERLLAGNYQLMITAVNWGGQPPIIGGIRGQPMPIVPNWLVNPPWAQWLITNGTQGEEPPNAVKRLYEIHLEFVSEADPQRRFELESEMYAIHNDNMWIIGSIKQPGELEAVWYGVFSNRLYNISVPVAPEWYYSVPSSWAMHNE